jgi:hypothetical protein
MSTMSIETPAALDAEILEAEHRNDLAEPAAWVGLTLTALFTSAAVLVVSLIAVVMGMR